MAYLKIQSFWHASPMAGITEGTPTSGGPVHYPNGGGHASLADMQAELCRRFKHRKPELLPDGVRMEGDANTYQIVTWSES